MAITNGYGTLAQLKERLRIDEDDAEDDGKLESVVDSVSRAIDEYAGRWFYSDTQTRYYTAEDASELEVDDLLSITALSTDEDGDRVYERTWTTDDYDLWPYNANTDGRPYTEIHTTPQGNYAFPFTRRGVEIEGAFGYSATTPPQVREACLLLCEQIFKRKDAIFGVVGTMGGEQLMRIAEDMLRKDPAIKMMLGSFVRFGVGAV